MTGVWLFTKTTDTFNALSCANPLTLPTTAWTEDLDYHGDNRGPGQSRADSH